MLELLDQRDSGSIGKSCVKSRVMSRVMAVGSISAIACLALATAALQLASPSGGSAWPSLGSAAMGIWWMGIAVFLWRK
jgi:hypothetical protein